MVFKAETMFHSELEMMILKSGILGMNLQREILIIL